MSRRKEKMRRVMKALDNAPPSPSLSRIGRQPERSVDIIGEDREGGK